MSKSPDALKSFIKVPLCNKYHKDGESHWLVELITGTLNYALKNYYRMHRDIKLPDGT